MFTTLHRGFGLNAALLSTALVLAGTADAALLQSAGPSSTVAFDSTLSGAALIYDANFYSATEGRLVMLASGSTLRGPGVPTGGSTPSQVYLGGTDSLRDLVITMRIDNLSGALISGTVNLPADNAAAGTADSWTTAGYITAFGSAASDGSGVNTFDARWFATGYDFADVAANPGLVGAPATCAAPGPAGTCGYGYLRFSTAAIPFIGGSGTGVNFAVDWVRGAGLSAPNAQLGAFDDNIATSAFASQAVTADVFVTPVPLPGPLALLLAGLAAGVPLVRRRAARTA